MRIGDVSFFQCLERRTANGPAWVDKVLNGAERYWQMTPNEVTYYPEQQTIQGYKPARHSVMPNSKWRFLKAASYLFFIAHYACRRYCPAATQSWAVRSVLWVGTVFPLAAALVKLWHRRAVGNDYYIYEADPGDRAISAEDRRGLDQLLGLEYGLIDGLESRDITNSEFEKNSVVTAPIERLSVGQDGNDAQRVNAIVINLQRASNGEEDRVVLYERGDNWVQRMDSSHPQFFNNNACLQNGEWNVNELDHIKLLQAVLRHGTGVDALKVLWTFDKATWEARKEV